MDKPRQTLAAIGRQFIPTSYETDKCEIILNHNDNIYYSGESITVNIELSFVDPKMLTGIVVTIVGFGRTKWARGLGIYYRRHTGYEEYFYDEEYIEGGRTNKIFELNTGVHDYTYVTKLPLNLPSSLDGEFGSIKYFVIVSLDNDEYKTTVQYKKQFRIIEAVTLDPRNLVPEDFEEEKFLYYCCIKRPGSILVKLILPTTGYIVGDELSYRIIIENSTNCDLGESTISFIQARMFICHVPRKENKFEEILIETKKYGNVLRQTKIDFDDELSIPVNIPPTTQNIANEELHIIIVEYFFQARILTGALYSDINIKIPIQIGTVVPNIQPHSNMSFDQDRPSDSFDNNTDTSYQDVFTKITRYDYD